MADHIVQFLVKLDSCCSNKITPRVFETGKQADRFAMKRTPPGHKYTIGQFEPMIERYVPMTDQHKLSI